MALQTAGGILSNILGRLRGRSDIDQPDMGAYDSALRIFFDNVNADAADLASGAMDVDTWRANMLVEIRVLFTKARAIGAGGIDNLTRRDMDAIRAGVQEQLSYLNAWAQQLRNADPMPSASVIASRARQYGRAARQMVFEAYSMAIGMPRLPFYPAQRTQCHSNCQCSWRIERLEGRGNYDCYWERSPVDSCETCRSRERAAYPLRIRNGQIQPFNTAGIYAR